MTLALCHGCKATKACAYCSLCDHWFCDECRPKWLSRTGEFFKQLVKGRTENCCGPLAISNLSETL